MKDNSTEKISICPERLSKLISNGRGKEKGPNGHYKRVKWKLKELEEKTGINYQTISKLCRGTSTAKKQNEHTVKTLAAVLDVDPEYLIGKQDILKRPTKEQSEKNREEYLFLQKIQRSRHIKAISQIASLLDWHIVLNGGDTYKDSVIYTSFDLYDEEGTLLCEKRDISDLDPFIQAMDHLLEVGKDLSDRFLTDLAIPDTHG